MDYESKQTYVNSFHDLTSLIITIGAALSVIIGLIGITNFINSMLTSIITRKKRVCYATKHRYDWKTVEIHAGL